MADTAKIRESRSSAPQAISEIDILWITAGRGCDGDTIAMTSTTQPSIEDVVLGSMPWIPKVRLHNPFLAMENGDDFLEHFRLAADGDLAPFILVVAGSIPDEDNKQEGYWASFGTEKKTVQPITACECSRFFVRITTSPRSSEISTTENDAVRLARSQAPVKQITTGTLCHLEAAMVQNARWKSGISINAISFLSKIWEPGMSFVLRSG